MASTSHASLPGTYSVPQRFGVSAILALTTLFAFIFAILRGFHAPAVFYLYFGTLAVSIALAQMTLGQVPRLASILAGAILLPFWVIVTAIIDERVGRFFLIGGVEDLMNPDFLLAIGSLALAGGFIGYLAGTLLAGFFLILDVVQSKGKRGLAPPPDSQAQEMIDPHA